MSMITQFYDEYLKTECGITAQRENLSAIIAEVVKSGANLQGRDVNAIISSAFSIGDIERIEDAITANEDAASERAFTAGFKAAMRLCQEVSA